MKKILLIATAALFAWTRPPRTTTTATPVTTTAMRPRQAITAARRKITAAPWVRA